jgi:multidrug efflux pump subunit AcrB
MALFVPFLLVSGMTSLLFRELILVIAGIVVVSLAVAVTVTPSLTSMLLGRGTAGGNAPTRFERFFDDVKEKYGRLLERMMGGRLAVVLLSGLILLAAGLLVGRLESNFLPPIDDGRVMVKVKLPTGAALAETDAVLRRIEEAISEDELIESAFTLSGGRVWGLYTYEIANEGEIDIQLVPRGRRGVSTDEYIERLRPVVSRIPVPGGNAMVMRMQIKGIRKMGEADIEVKVRGPEMAELYEYSRQVSASMNELNHFTNIYVSMDMTKPEYQVKVDRPRAAELGVSVSDIAAALRSYITGAVATRYREGDEYYNIRVMISPELITNRGDVENLTLNSPGGGYLRVSDVAKVAQASGPVEIVREDQVKEVNIRGDASGASVGKALSELQRALASKELPAGYEISYGGQARLMADMKNTVYAILAFGVFFAFIVLAVQFNSLKLPALILASVPVCLAGSVFLLHMAHLPLGATVIIGVLVVIAATINDGVLLLTFANDLREERGMSPLKAVLDAARIRMRPRIMTTVTTMMGFLPLALNLEEGGDMLQPMAVAAIGGLGLEILVALFLMPCMYVMMSRR